MKKLIAASLLIASTVHAGNNNNGWILVNSTLQAVNGSVHRNARVIGRTQYDFQISGSYKKTKICKVVVSLCMFRNECVKKQYDYVLKNNINIYVADELTQAISYPDKAKYTTDVFIVSTCDTQTNQRKDAFGMMDVR